MLRMSTPLAALMLLGGCTHFFNKASASSGDKRPFSYSIRKVAGVVPFDFLSVEPSSPRDVCLVLFPGGKRSRHFIAAGDSPKMSNNFLMRMIPDLVRLDYRVVVPGSLSNDVKTNQAEETALRRMYQIVEDDGCQRLYLLATSRGTVSALHSMSLITSPIAGIALTATIANEQNFAETFIPVGKLPVLMVHHSLDGCPSSPLQAAREMSIRLAKVANVEFYEISGGQEESKSPCAARTHHGFWGAEPRMLGILTTWLAVMR